jgi:hypothetical protein
MTPDELTEELARIVQATMECCSAWSRGSSCTAELKVKKQVIENFFNAMTGRLPTREQHEKIGTEVASLY